MNRIAVTTLIVCLTVATNASARQDPALGRAFQLYCAADDSSTWFCAERPLTMPALTDAQKWDILVGYCLDDEEHSATRIEAGVNESITKANAAKPACDALKVAREPLTLRFDHRAAKWEDSKARFTELDRRYEADPVTGVPTVHLVKGDRIGIIVTETNPLVFAANRGEAKEDNIEQMKNLEKLFGFLATGLGLLTSDAGVARAEEADRTPTSEEHDREWLKQQAGRLQAPMAQLSEALRTLVDERSRLQVAAQMLEKGPAKFAGPIDRYLEDPEFWHHQFSHLGSAVALVSGMESCEALFAAFPPLTTTENPMEVDAFAVGLEQLLDAPKPPCGVMEYPAVVEAVAIEIQDVARQVVAGSATLDTLRARQARARAEDLQTVLVLHRMLRQLNATRVTAREQLAKEEDTRKGAVALNIVADRVRDAALRRDVKGTPLDQSDDEWLLTNRIYVPDEVYSTAWSKMRTTALRITVNSPFADQVPTSRPKDVSTSYRMVRKNFDRFSVGAGIVYTKAKNTVYVAVDPNPDTNKTVTQTESVPQSTNPDGSIVPKTDTITTHPELKEIAVKETQSRAGSFGLFGNYRLWNAGVLGLGVQGGVAMSADNPAFMAGLSINAGDYVIAGVGCGAFRVKTLGIGPSGVAQQVGDKVIGNDDIRIANRWSADCGRESFYFSLTVNLTGLPLFSPK